MLEMTRKTHGKTFTPFTQNIHVAADKLSILEAKHSRKLVTNMSVHKDFNEHIPMHMQKKMNVSVDIKIEIINGV